MAPKVHPSKVLTYIASIFAITLWGMSYIWTDKILAFGIPVFYFVFVRILLAGLTLFLFNTAFREKTSPSSFFWHFANRSYISYARHMASRSQVPLP